MLHEILLSCLSWGMSSLLGYVRLEKKIYRTASNSLAISREPLAHHTNVVSSSFFHNYYFARCLFELAELVSLRFPMGGPLVILIGCIFFSSLSDFLRIIMSPISFLAKLDPGILCLQNAFFIPLM